MSGASCTAVIVTGYGFGFGFEMLIGFPYGFSLRIYGKFLRRIGSRF